MSFDDFRIRLARALVLFSAASLVGLHADSASPRKSAAVSAAPVVLERTISSKVDPFLRRLIRDNESRAPMTWALPSEGAPPFIRTEVTAGGELAAAVFVRTTDVGQTKATLAALGGTFRVEVGDIAVGVVPVTSLELLADQAETVSIEASSLTTPQLDVSRPATKADLVQAGTGLVGPRTGSGVIVGVVDTGIDYTRADFKTSSGSTRIRSIWDLAGVATGGSAMTCSPSDIAAATCPEVDLNGHGTHVAGAAAGNGRLQPGFIGMAPDAEIIAAKATRSTTAAGSFYDDDVVAACSYVFQQAQAAGKPAVINLSLGGIYGRPLDGTSSYEQALSNLTGPGKVIVASAGNSGSSVVHLSYPTTGASYADSLETPWTAASDNSAGYVGIWYGSGSISVGIAARTSPDQNSGIYASAAYGPGNSTGGVIDLKDSTGTILAHFQVDATTTSYSSNGAHFVTVMVQPVASGQYFSLYTFGSGTFDAWSSNMTFGTRTDSYWRPGDTQMTIGSPGTARKVISIGAYTTKKQWVDVNGTSQSFTSWCGSSYTDALGDIACFSSHGPTRDGRTKPDITAPGHRIASDLSTSATTNQAASNQMQGGKLLLLSGTSQAAPHITGIVALMLQANPALTYDQAVQTLQSTATKDSFTGSTTNNTWGAGKVNALEAVKAMGGGGGGGGGSPCVSDATTLCLHSNRFRVTADYVAGGTPGHGQAVKLPGADDSGYFWFFDVKNMEVVGKIASFCSGSSGQYGFYVSGLTDVQVTVTITDTKDGTTWHHDNANGQNFCKDATGGFSCP